MSARGPFATVVEDGFDSTEPDAVYIGTVRISSHGCPTIAQKHAAAINAAHADRVAEELEAAADAMAGMTDSEANVALGCRYVEHAQQMCNCEDIQDWLRARAKAIREGGGK